MPHSSGGGSHSGGSHSSHSSSSHHSSGGGSHRGGSHSSYQKPIVVTSPTRGYSRYAFYRNGGIRYEYIKDKPEHASPVFWIIYAVSVLPFIIMACMCMSSFVQVIKPLDPATYNSVVQIEDYADYLTDAEEADLLETFTAFRDKTGIACDLVTCRNEDWQNNYDNMEPYAYDLYVNRWSDESHWLFVYSEPEEIPEDGFVDWYWEGMQGNDTDILLPASVVDEFTEILHRAITDRGLSVGRAWIMSMTELMTTMKTSGLYVPPAVIFPAAIFAFIFMHVCGMIVNTVKSERKEARLIEKRKDGGIMLVDIPLEDTCTYCGGVYIHGKHLNCPHCGASITPMPLAKELTSAGDQG